MVSLSRPQRQQQPAATAPWLRRRSVGATTATRPSSSSKRSTLFKMLVVMLSMILLLYLMLMVAMVVRHGDNEDHHTNNNNKGMSLSASDPLWHHHSSEIHKQKLPHMRGVRQPLDDLRRKEDSVEAAAVLVSSTDQHASSLTDKKKAPHEMSQPDDRLQKNNDNSILRDAAAAAQQQKERRHKKQSLDETAAMSTNKNKLGNLLGEQSDEPMDLPNDYRNNNNNDHVLRAYLEPVNQKEWNVKPLPIRTTTATAQSLKVISYPRVTSCTNLLEQFPVNDDNPIDAGDPFLPWIHDVFPTHDGKYIQFVAQNKRRCQTGTTREHAKILHDMQPQVALFQDVPVKRLEEPKKNTRMAALKDETTTTTTTRYRLSSHHDADVDGVSTRFICRFKPSMEETLSVYNVNYEYATWRKSGKHTFTKEGHDNKSLHTVQLLFQCPVPLALQEIVKNGSSVVNDYATLFVDVIPIRTPPRYGPPEAFFPPQYKEHEDANMKFDPLVEWGEEHVLPRIEDSGRWENLPICKPSLLTYESNDNSDEDNGNNKNAAEAVVVVKTEDNNGASSTQEESKRHRLIACVWASSGYATRGERFAINDGQRRLKEWLAFNFLVGFDHIYVYDNSGARTTKNETTFSSLKPVTDLFPDDKVTRIAWPAKVCNNNRNYADSPGERSSQYAAEASCRLRFGAHAEWLGGFDIDEYLVPLGNFSNIPQLLDKLDKEGNKIISFGSWRAWPRKSLIEEPQILKHPDGLCRTKKDCFDVRVPPNHTYLQTYNCDRQKGAYKEKQMPAEKQVYRPDYVKQHFVHYSTITETSAMSKKETLKAGNKGFSRRIHVDPLSRFANEMDEATMLHTKAIATQDTADWLKTCKGKTGTCRIGNPYPEGAFEANITKDDEGWIYNCYLNERIENYWVPQLEKELDKLAP